MKRNKTKTEKKQSKQRTLETLCPERPCPDEHVINQRTPHWINLVEFFELTSQTYG